MEITSGIGAALVAFGASLALAFIVMLIIGIAMVALLYLGSAVVVLERFARVSTKGGWVVFFGLVMSMLVGLVLLGNMQPEASGQAWDEWLPIYLGFAGRLALGSVISVLILRFVLGRVEGKRLGLWVLGLSSFGISCSVSVVVPMVWLMAPVGVSIVGTLWLRHRRVGRGQSEPGELEAVLLWFAAPWALGFVNLLVPLERQDAVASSGGAIIAVFGVLVVLGLVPVAAAGLLEMRRSVE